MESNYTVGKDIISWSNGETQTITFIVTEDCNLRCKYCYITHKASNRKMNFDTAKKFIDYIFTNEIKKKQCVIIEFIGGEPLLEIRLIDKISDYFKVKSYLSNHPWYWNYRFNICTNGVNFNDNEVQNYIEKNKGKLSVTITIDGTKEKHDLQRVFPDGRGSYDQIVKNIPNWLSKFNPGTKVTFASDDLKYLKESIISLWNLGVIEVAANVVFEDVWKNGDDLIFENQLIQLANYIIDNKLYNKFKCTLFDEQIGYPYTKEEIKKTYCGAGKMLALGPNGNIYPCLRYKDYSLNKNKELIFGTVDKGIDMEKVRPFLLTNVELQSDSECLNCEIATGCAFCQGFNYDESKSSTNFYRSKYICKMHKARVRANNYYFNRLYNELNIKKDINRENKNKLYFLLSSHYTTYCHVSNKTNRNEVMNSQIMLEGLNFAHRNFFEIIFVHPNNEFNFQNSSNMNNYMIKHIIPIKFFDKAKDLKNVIWVLDKDTIETLNTNINNCIININENEISNLMKYINNIYKKVNRININITDISEEFDFKLYKEQLCRLKDLVIKINNDYGYIFEINILTDLLYINEHDNCKAGDTSFTLGSDGKLYICPAYYSKGIENEIGNIYSGISKISDKHLYELDFKPLCRNCNSYQCINCIYLNKEKTNEINISPSFQCKKAHVEQEIAFQLRNELADKTDFKKIEYPKYTDPMQSFINEKGFLSGIYKID